MENSLYKGLWTRPEADYVKMINALWYDVLRAAFNQILITIKVSYRWETDAIRCNTNIVAVYGMKCDRDYYYYYYYYYYFLWHCSPAQAMVSSSTTFLDHIQRRATVGRNLLDE
jgi:hypothetical protein